jgi:hypothetical protein
MNPSTEREATAYHEAGHAVIGYMFNAQFCSVSIKPNEDSSGRVLVTEDYYQRYSEGRRERRSVALASFGGPLAEAKYLGMMSYYPRMVEGGCPTLYASGLFSDSDIDCAGWRDDWNRCEGSIIDHPMVSEVWSLLERDDIWRAVTEVALALQETEEMSSGEVFRLIKRHVPVKWARRKVAA